MPGESEKDCAAREKRTALIIFIDEIQYIEESQFAALIMALHKCTQKQLPVTMVGAGLPQLVGQAGRAKSYAERLFEYPEIGPLAESAAKDGYGRYFTYVGGSAGHAICTSEPRFPLSVHQRLPNGSLPQIVPAAGDGDPIVIILISHKINGYGAWEGEIGKTHQKLSGTYGPDEHENVKATQAFIVAPVSYERRSYYDDHVIWITRNHLLAMYAKMICNPSERPFV
jgi:hypothetical protein